MRELHIHLHLDPELLSSSDAAIHLHLTSGDQGGDGDPFPPSGVEASTGAALTAQLTSGAVTDGANRTRQLSLRDEQRIRSRIYRGAFVPPTEDSGARAYYDAAQSSDLADGLMLELASGNQLDPIVWDSFRPQRQRGMWRFTVREEFGRLIGTMAHAADPAAVWILSEWTPRGALVLEPADPSHYPRIQLQPSSRPVA